MRDQLPEEFGECLRQFRVERIRATASEAVAVAMLMWPDILTTAWMMEPMTKTVTVRMVVSVRSATHADSVESGQHVDRNRGKEVDAVGWLRGGLWLYQ